MIHRWPLPIAAGEAIFIFSISSEQDVKAVP
jgi:hypothetical protein